MLKMIDSPDNFRIFFLNFLFVVVLASQCSSILLRDRYYGSHKVSMLMPNVQPKKKDSYLCIAVDMPEDDEYIVEIYPNSTMEIAHHILVFECLEPGYTEPENPRAVWECKEMLYNYTDVVSPYPHAVPCKKGILIMYDWAMNATKVTLPLGVGFKVGKKTKIPKMVVQVHYSHVERFLAGETDQSGIIVTMVPDYTKQITKRAQTLVLGTTGTLQANSIDHMETECQIKQNIEIHPFAFRTHTHKLGTLVSGWFIRDGKWTLIGKADPQQPQIFYPIEDESMVVRQNDILAARCTMNNYRPYTVSVGPTGDDEMCNFDLMYWVDSNDDLKGI